MTGKHFADLTTANSEDVRHLIRAHAPWARTTMPEIGSLVAHVVEPEIMLIQADDANDPEFRYTLPISKTNLLEMPGDDLDEKIIAVGDHLNRAIKAVFN